MRHIPSPYSFNHLSDVFTFGAYKGFTLSDVIDSCSDYIYWCMNNILRFHLEDSVMEEIHLIYPNQFLSPLFEQKRQWNFAHWMDEYLEEDDDDDYCDSVDYDDEEPTYNRYNGSWAQDEMGYSDDDIDTVFDGDPDAYWNID